MENSHIEWTDHTFNPWVGCTKVSPGCAHCYAEARDQRFAGGIHWGKGATRQRTSATNWRAPLRWNRNAADRLPPTRPRVFCASLADWLDDEVPIEWLADLLALIHATPNLDWLLLTKRPELFFPRMCKVSDYWEEDSQQGRFLELFDWLENEWMDERPFPNVWIGTSVEDQQRADERIPRLLEIPAQVRFLSCEPLLGAVDLGVLRGIGWVIGGGESGAGARPMHPDWARSLRDQCQAAGVPFHFKQWGEWECHHESEWGGVSGNGEKWRVIGPRGHAALMHRAGKKATGRILDGRTWDEFPRQEAHS